MKNRIYILFLTGMLLASGGAKAQNQDITINDAVDIALKKNRDLQVATLETLKSKEKITEARAAILPNVNASAQYLRYMQRQISFLPGSFAGLDNSQLAVLRVGGEHAFLGGVNLSQPLFLPSAFSGIRLAKLSNSITREDQATVRAAVVTNVKKSYLDVLIAQEQLKLQEQSLNRNIQALKDSRALLAQGRASRVDTLRAFVSVENIKPEIIRLRNRVEINKTILKRIIGLDEEEAIQLRDSLTLNDPLTILTENEISDEAIQARPEVKKQDLTAQYSAEQITTRSVERIPKLMLVGSYQVQQQARNLHTSEYDWPSTSYAGLQLNIPIFAGFREVSKVRQAAITRQQSETSLQNLKEVVKAEVKIGVSNLQESQNRIVTQQQTVTTAELSYRITHDRWKQGIASRLDLTDAEFLLSQSKSNYVQAIYDYLVASIELERIAGRIR